MMSIEEDYWVSLEKFKGFPGDPAFSARFRKSSVEEGKGEYQKDRCGVIGSLRIGKEEGIGSFKLKGNRQNQIGEKFFIDRHDFLQRRNRLLKERRAKEGSIDPSATARPILVDPNLRAITALVVVLGTFIGTAADGLFVDTPIALYGSFIPVFIVAAVIVPPHAKALRRRVALKGVVVIVVIHFFLFFRGAAFPEVVLAFRLQFLVDKELKIFIPAGQGLVVFRPGGGGVVLQVPFFRGTDVRRRLAGGGGPIGKLGGGRRHGGARGFCGC
jgi:hypothetical protein